MPINPNIPRCKHIKTNGACCGSPALTNNSFCYFHHRAYLQRDHFQMPLVEDANSLQMAINEVLRGMFSGQIDMKEAHQALYGLRIAAIVMPRTRFQPGYGDDVAATPYVTEDLLKRAATAVRFLKETTPPVKKAPTASSNQPVSINAVASGAVVPG